MNDSLIDQASLYVLDRLNAVDREEFEQCMATNAELLELVREMEINLEEQVRTLPSQKAPSGAWDAIDAQIEEEQEKGKTVSFPLSAWAGWGVAAALFIALGVSLFKPDTALPGQGAQEGFLLVGLHPESSVSEWLHSGLKDDAEDDRFYQLASMAENLWENLGHYSASQVQREAMRGFALIDPVRASGFIGVKELPPVNQGKSYLVWAVNAQSKAVMPVGMLPMDGNDDGMFCFDLSALPGHGKGLGQWSFFITEESVSAGSDSVELPVQPNGRRVLGYDDI